MLAASGVLLSWPKATGVVCDIGGSSLELAFVENGKIKITQSFEIGPLALQDYNKIGKSSFEIVKEKLSKIKPPTLGAASRISGLTPAGTIALLRYIKKNKNKKAA